jgi:hypothetical protein
MIDRVGSALLRSNPWLKVMATRYVLRTGEVIHSNRNPEELDVYCYRTGANDHTCLLLSDQSEADFLLRYGSDELNVAY